VGQVGTLSPPKTYFNNKNVKLNFFLVSKNYENLSQPVVFFKRSVAVLYFLL